MNILQSEIIETQTSFSTTFGGKPSFHPLFPFSWALPPLLGYIYFHCSYLYNYYNYSRTLCIKCRYWDLIKFLYFVGYHSMNEGIAGWKQAQRQGEGRVTLGITLLICLQVKWPLKYFFESFYERHFAFTQTNWVRIPLTLKGTVLYLCPDDSVCLWSDLEYIWMQK